MYVLYVFTKKVSPVEYLLRRALIAQNCVFGNKSEGTVLQSFNAGQSSNINHFKFTILEYASTHRFNSEYP